MAVVGARACLDLTLATLRPGGLAKRTSSARAGRMSRCEKSRLAETELASAKPRTDRLTRELSGQINREAIDWSA